MKKIVALFGMFIFMLAASIIAQRGTVLHGPMQIAQDGSGAAAEDAASQSCAHIRLGSEDLSEGEEYADEDLAMGKQAEMYDEIQGGENEEGAAGEVACEELPSGELSCTDENGQPLSGCVADEEGYVICD